MDTKAVLYFGADIKGTGLVSETQFATFLRDDVTPAFPGFTVVGCVGYWEGKAEPTRTVTILGDSSAPAFRLNVAAIARAYKDRFAQGSVLVEFSNVTGSLI
jgi:hypothetical protein